MATWLWLLLGGGGAVVGFYLGVVALGFLFWLLAIPELRAERTAAELKEQMNRAKGPEWDHDFEFDVQRLRYLAGDGGLPTQKPVPPWRGLEIETRAADELLEPVRMRLAELGQHHLARQLRLPEGSADAHDLHVALDRVGLLARDWPTSGGNPPFRFGRRGKAVARRLPKRIQRGEEISRAVNEAEGPLDLRACYRQLRRWDRRARRLVRTDGGPWATEFGVRSEVENFPYEDRQQLQNLIDAKVHRLREMNQDLA
jgi:hypothetical protein